jgi:type IV secretion system protein VirB6
LGRRSGKLAQAIPATGLNVGPAQGLNGYTKEAILESFTFAGMWTLISGFFVQLNELSGSLCDAVRPLVYGGLMIQIAWQGFNIMRGQGGSNHVLDIFAKSLRVMIVGVVALEAGSYNQWIVGMISGPDGLSQGILNLLPGEHGATPFAELDTAFQLGLKSYADAEKWGLTHLIVPRLYFIGLELTFPGVTVIIANGIFFCLFIVLLVLAFADLLVNTIALAIIFAVGPLFLACYAFPAVENYATTWLSAALKWTFTNVVIVIVVNLFVFIATNFIGMVSHTNNGAQIIAAIFGEIMAVLALMIVCGKTHQIAADLVGGIGMNGMTGRMAQMASGAMSGGLKGAISGGAKGGGLGGAFKGGTRGAARASLEGALGMGEGSLSRGRSTSRGGAKPAGQGPAPGANLMGQIAGRT